LLAHSQVYFAYVVHDCCRRLQVVVPLLAQITSFFVAMCPWQHTLCCLKAQLLKGGDCHVPCHFIPLSYSFSFISIHPFIHSHSLYIFWSQSPMLSFSFPSGLLFYTLVLVHIMCPSSRLFHISLICDCYIVASLFQLCTLLVLHSHILLVVLFNSLFRQLYSLLVPLVWDQLECALFFQSLVPPFPFHLEFTPSSSLLLGCCSSP